MNEQKELFAKAKLRGLSNREAAIAAGYSEKTASASGSRLAKDVDVLAEIERLKLFQSPEPVAVAVEPSPGVVVQEAQPIQAVPVAERPAEAAESLDRIALSARERAVVRGTTIELDGVCYDQTDPKDQLILCSLGVISLNRQQIDAAKALLGYFHGKVADQGKKDVERERAHDVAGGKFSPMRPPESVQGRLC
nr:MAG TPA: TERMINASE SMALL SUBUNIT [Caudoviricetes sp.]